MSDRFNVPNALTLAGGALGFWWIAGGPDWAAVASVVLDELDGIAARRLDEETELGSRLDWATDVALTPFVFDKLGIPWQAIPAASAAQVALRCAGQKPPLLSFRALGMLYSIAKRRGYL